MNIATALSEQARPSFRKGMIEEALREFRTVGCKDGEARALNNLAGLLEDTGQPDEALKTYGQALEVFDEVGDRGQIANTQNNIGTFLETEGNLAGALKKYEASSAIWSTLKSPGGVAIAEGNIAEVLYMMGRPTTAVKRWDEVLAIGRKLGSEPLVGGALGGIGDILAAEGRLASAKDSYEKSLVIARTIGGPMTILSLLNKLTILAMLRGNLQEAHRLIKEASRLQEHVSQLWGHPGADNKLVAARLLLEESKPPEAEVVARVAIQEIHERHGLWGEASGRLVLVRSLLAQSKMAEANIQVNQVATFLKRFPNEVIRLDYLITAARVKAASGNVADISEALQMLGMALDETQKAGYVAAQLEARLAKGEIEMKLVDTSIGATHLQELVRDAGESGFQLMADKAVRALGSRQ